MTTEEFVAEQQRLRKQRSKGLSRVGAPHCGTFSLGDDYFCSQCGDYHFPPSAALDEKKRKKRVKFILRQDDRTHSLEDDDSVPLPESTETLMWKQPQKPISWLSSQPIRKSKKRK